MIKYEELDEYNLDMIHFGSEQGILTDVMVQNRVTEKVSALRLIPLGAFESAASIRCSRAGSTFSSR